MTNLNIRIDAELKARTQEILSQMGLDMTTAVTLFFKQVVQRREIPFSISAPPESNKL